jgi:hypothetical protein
MLRWGWGLAALLCTLGTTALATADRRPVLTLAAWLSSGVFASLMLRGYRASAPARDQAPWSPREVTVVAAILTLAAAARLLWLDALPRYYFGDEPRVAEWLQHTYAHGIPNFFHMGWNTWPVIGLSLQALFVPVFGFSLTVFRLSSALMGTLAVVTTYLLARHLFTPRVAGIAALLMAFGRTAIEFSRLGVCHAQVVFFETLAFACWWRAVGTGSAVSYLWAGIGLGLCLYTYNAGEMAPVLWLGWLGVSVVLAPRSARRRPKERLCRTRTTPRTASSVKGRYSTEGST